MDVLEKFYKKFNIEPECYPHIDSTMLLKLLCIYNYNCGLLENCIPRNYNTLKNDLLKMMMNEDNIIDWLPYYREVRNTLIQGE